MGFDSHPINDQMTYVQDTAPADTRPGVEWKDTSFDPPVSKIANAAGNFVRMIPASTLEYGAMGGYDGTVYSDSQVIDGGILGETFAQYLPDTTTRHLCDGIRIKHDAASTDYTNVKLEASVDGNTIVLDSNGTAQGAWVEFTWTFGELWWIRGTYDGGATDTTVTQEAEIHLAEVHPHKHDNP